MTGPYASAVERFPRLRQSLMSDFDNCPLSCAFLVAWERGWSSFPAARGTIVHRVIAKAIQELMVNDDGSGRSNPDVVVDDLLPEIIRQHEAADGVGWDENGELVVPDGLAPESQDVVVVPLREIAQARISLKAWSQHVTLTVENIAGVEKRIDEPVYYPDGAGGMVERMTTGQLDVLLIEDTTAIVIDWKDTFDIPPESSISEEGYFQQRDYSMRVFRRYPRVQRVILREFYVRYASGKVVRHGKPVNPVREAVIDRYNLPEVEAELSALVERFDRAFSLGRFKVSPGSHCGYCSAPGKCPIPAEVRGEGAITTPEGAEEVAGVVNRAEAVLKQARAALRAWSKDRGDVPVKDAKRPRVFGPVVRTITERPTLDQVRAALEAGQPVDALYVTRQRPEFGMHSPEEQHPFAKAAREEEERLLALEQAGDFAHRGRS